MRSFAPFLLGCVGLVAAHTDASSQPSTDKPILKWGASGHSTVAAIAMSMINSNVTSMANRLLPDVNGDLTQIASWADSLRDDPSYKWSLTLHYINTPDWKCNYDRARDCTDEYGNVNFCVDMAIQNYTSRLADSTLSDDDRTEAIKFLVHFAGDISQPLHVGFTGDEGGNTEYGNFMTYSNERLHEIWDTLIISKRVKDDFNNDLSSFQQSLITRIQTGDFAKDVSTWMTCNGTETHAPYSACSIEWANESVRLACDYAYVEADGTTHITDGFDLQQDYYDRNLPIVELQLARGGVRLANMLNHIFPSSSSPSYAAEY